MKNILPPFLLAQNVNLAVVFHSKIIDFTHLDNFAVQANFTGAPNGVLSTETSIDGVNFAPFSSLTITTIGTQLIDGPMFAPMYMRVSWSPLVGSAGAMELFCSGKAM